MVGDIQMVWVLFLPGGLEGNMVPALGPGLPAGGLAVVLGTGSQRRWPLGLSWLCGLCLRLLPLKSGLREDKTTVTILSKYTSENSMAGFSD